MIKSINPAERAALAEALGPLPSAHSRADLELIAQAMGRLTDDAKPFFAYELVHQNLMLFQDPMMNMAVEMARSEGRLTEILAALFEAFPEIVDALIEQAVDHCLNGTDATDPQSAGGWSQDEVVKCYASLYVARNGLTIPFGVNIQ